MAKVAEQNADEKTERKALRAHLDDTGNSRMTQALGATFTVGLIAWSAITLAMGTVLYLGQKKWPKLKESLQWVDKEAFPWVGRQFMKLVPQTLKNKFANGKTAHDGMSYGTALATSGGVAVLLSKIVAVPWFRLGWRKAEEEKLELHALRKTVSDQQQTIGDLQNRQAEIAELSAKLEEKAAGQRSGYVASTDGANKKSFSEREERPKDSFLDQAAQSKESQLQRSF